MSKKIPNKSIKSRTKPLTGAFSVQPAHSEAGELNCKLPLYRFVYASQTSLVLVVLLLFSFLLQGVERVYANEIEDASTDSVQVTADPNKNVVAEISVPELLPDIPQTNEFGSTNNDESLLPSTESPASEEVFEDTLVPEVVFTDEIADTGADLSSEEEVATVYEDTAVAEGISEENEYEVGREEGLLGEETGTEESQSEKAEEIIDETQDLLDDVTIDTSLVASNTVIATEVLSYTESDSVFSFSKKECTELATGSYYCHKPQENQLQDALFSAPDADGDLEIFLVRAGVQTQVTTNTIDDAAPYYDQNSNTIVWHRLIDDRYQIVSYDIAEGSEQVLTSTPENNMEPTRQGNYTVWQRWIDGGWNIILYDGQQETQITKTTSHNVAPYIHGSLVVWNRHDQVNDKTIEMYDMVSKTYVSVEDPDGMSVSNPRMVFVYDSLHPNGDVITKGYDVLAKKFIELDSLPRELPEEIPESDSTGETRALIQFKSSSKSEVEEATPFPDTASSTVSSSTTPVATTSVPVILGALTLDLTTATATEPLPEVNVSYEIPPAELDLVVEPYISSSSSTIDSVQE